MHALNEKSYLDQRGAQSAVLVLRSGKPALQRRPSVSAYLRTYEDKRGDGLKEAVVLERVPEAPPQRHAAAGLTVRTPPLDP
jgi:hypothetical protein